MPRARLLAFVLLAALVASACQKERDPANPAEMKAKLEPKVRMMLWKVDATHPQEKAIDGLLTALSGDLYGFQQEQKGITRSLIEALGGENVDQPALAAAQKRAVALFDRYTGRMMKAATDLSSVLTPAQRQKLVSLWRDWEFSE
jgi:Spy/CpxP family protein refolding chaperone